MFLGSMFYYLPISDWYQIGWGKWVESVPKLIYEQNMYCGMIDSHSITQGELLTIK